MMNDECLEKLYRECLEKIEDWDIWRIEATGDFIIGSPDRKTIFATVAKGATPAQINQVLVAYKFGYEDGLYTAKALIERGEL